MAAASRAKPEKPVAVLLDVNIHRPNLAIEPLDGYRERERSLPIGGPLGLDNTVK